MFSLYLECDEQEAEILSAELWEEGASGIQEEQLPGSRCQLRAWFDDASGLLQRFSEFQPRLESEPDIDWEAASRQAWQPFAIGRRLYLAPEWDESPTPQGRLRLTIHPGGALGTGAHPATQLCLEALESSMHPGDRVLDIGTGSGILTAAAILLGARTAVGCDIDFDSVCIARQNLTADALRPHVFAGSTRSVRARSIDLVVANINAVTHESLAAEYGRISRRALVLSGFPARQASRVAAVLEPFGYSVTKTLTLNEWICLVLCNAETS